MSVRVNPFTGELYISSTSGGGGGGTPNVEAEDSVIIGLEAATNATGVATGNVVIGNDAARNTNLGNFNGNIAIGKNALKDFVGAGGTFFVTAVGEEAMQGSAQSSCVAVGRQSLLSAQGTGSTCVGTESGKNCFANSGTFLGRGAGQDSGNSTTATSGTTYIGQNAGKGAGGTGKVTTSKSVAIGQFAGESSEGTGSVFVGKSSGAFASGQNTIGIGEGAARSSSGANTVAIGLDAGLLNSIPGQFIIRNSSMPSYADRATAVAAITTGNGARADNTYLYYNEATTTIEAVRL